MIRSKNVLCMLMVAGCMLAFAGPADAHTGFKKYLAEKFEGKKISCNACHVDKKPKSERNALGQLFQKQFTSKTLSADLKAKKIDKEALMKEFDASYKKVVKMSVEDLMKAGFFDGITNPEE